MPQAGYTLYWFAVCVVALFAKMLAVSLYQGWHRIGKLSFKNEEDARFAHRQPLEQELPQVRRAQQVWLNDLENIPIFIALGLIWLWLGAPAQVAPALFVAFTAARILHTVFYLARLQPWRTLAYTAGLVVLVWMCAAILRLIPAGALSLL
jgi:uncharacterized MAPEG superfamily protein